MSLNKFSYLKKFCYCMELVTGVRVMTGLALIFGDGYIIMGAALYDDCIPSFVLLSAVAYYVSGGLFCLWFLLLLVLQSLNSKFPRTLALIHTKLLILWLFITFVVIVVALNLLSRCEHVNIYRKDHRLLQTGIFVTVLAIIITIYNFWVLKSYINLLEEEDESNVSTSTVRFLSFLSEDFSEQVADLPKLDSMPPLHRQRMIRTLRKQSEFRKVRASRISVLSESHMSILSKISSSQLEDEKNSNKESRSITRSEPSQKKIKGSD